MLKDRQLNKSEEIEDFRIFRKLLLIQFIWSNNHL